VELTPDDVSDDLDLVDNTARVDVLQADPETGAELSRASGVLVIKRQEDMVDKPVGDGFVPTRVCRWHLKARDMAFVPREYDRVEDDASGETEVWVVTKVTKAAFATRYVIESYFYAG
jgi:hypothetical protein